MRSGVELQHAVNGWLQGLLGPGPSAGRARSVTVPSRYEEDQEDDLATAAQSVTRATMGALQKQIRAAGFKGAEVSGWGKGTDGGFTVRYQGQDYRFSISEAQMRNNGRGLYYQTGVAKNDMVLHQDHRGRWRIDLITSAGGNHVDVTGPNRGYNSAHEAFVAAQQEKHRRGLPDTAHAWLQLADGGIVDYVPEGASGVSRGQREIFPNGPRRSRKLPSERNTPEIDQEVARDFANSALAGEHPDFETVFEHGQWFVQCLCGAQWSVVDTSRGFDFERVSDGDEGYHYEPNGPRTGILSDGTRVNVYHKPGTIDAYTTVPHSETWDSMERRGMRSMLGTDASGRGFSQWTEGQEGRHLGRKIAWVEVPEELKQHIERRVAQETMVANGRATTVDEVAKRELELYIENEYSLIGAPNSIGKSIDANMRSKVERGDYDPALAARGWQYLIDAGAKKYEAEFGDRSPVFNAATRRALAEDYAREWERENGVSHLPNARRVPEHLQGYEDWSYEDFYQDMLDDGRTRSDARLQATRLSHDVGRLGFLPPRNIPKGWTLHSKPIFRRRDAKPAFEAHKGSKYMVFGLDGKPLSPELRRLRGLLEWRDEHGWVGN